MINYNDKFTHKFVKTYDVINKDLCKRCIKSTNKSNNWEQHTFYNELEKSSHARSGSDELSVLGFHKAPGEEKNMIMKALWSTIGKYFKDLETPWFAQWNGYSGIRFNRYKKNKKMAFHCDHIHTIFDGKIRGVPSLSVLGALNDNYEGGEFQFAILKQDKCTIDTPEFNKTGMIIVFPSDMEHRVAPVTKGIRYSLVVWFLGPPFK